MFPTVSCLDRISNDLIGLVASFLPFNFLVQFLKLPCEPRLADSEEDLKQLLRFWLPKRTASFLSSSWVRHDLVCRISRSRKATPDLWEEIVKSLDLKYSVNEIPENVNWSSLRIVIDDLPADLAVRRVISFLRDKIPPKYLSDGLTYVVQLLVITEADDSKETKYRFGYWYISETLKLEFYEVNGLKHCDWYLFESQEVDLRSDKSIFVRDDEAIFVLHFEENSTNVHLKKSRSNDESYISPKGALPSGWVTCESNEWDIGDVAIINLATYLFTAYDQNVGTSCDSSNTNDSKRDESSISSSGVPLSLAEVPAKQLRTNHLRNVELLLNEIRRYIADGTLRQLWTKIAILFEISNFTFIDHQDQTTPVHTPTDLVALTDSFFDSREPDPHRATTSDYSTCIENSALSTAYRNNSCCLKARKSFNVDVVVLHFIKHANSSLRGVLTSRHQLEMSMDKRCSIKRLGLMSIDFAHRESLPGALFDIFASLRHRPLQVECWDRKQGSDDPPFRNPFGFVTQFG